MAKRQIKEFEIMKEKSITANKLIKIMKVNERCSICGDIISCDFVRKISSIHQLLKSTLYELTQPQRTVDNIKTLSDGRKVCGNCFNTMYCDFIHNHRSNGEKLGIKDIESIKVRFEHRRIRIYRRNMGNVFQDFKMMFTMKCYIKLYSLKNIGRTATTFGSDNEITINDEFIPYCIPTYENFHKRMIKHSNAARIKEKKELLKDEKLIKYIYDCIVKSMNIGVDKYIFGL